MSHVCDGRDLSCASCEAVRRRHDTVRAAMMLDDRLDDIKRARIWTGLEDRLVEGTAPRRSRWPVALGATAAMAVAAAAALLLVRTPAPSAAHVLAVPVDTTVSSQLGPHTAASIVGPAQLDLLDVVGDATEVRLRSGTLLAEFTGGAKRSLRIEAPGAVIDVVGTLFAVQVRGATTCTSVAHGRVRVTTSAGVVEVGGGQRHCTGDALRPIDDDMRDALARQGAVVAGRAELPTVPTPGPPAPTVAPTPTVVPTPARAVAPAIATQSPGAVDTRPIAPPPHVAIIAPRTAAPREPIAIAPRTAAPREPIATAPRPAAVAEPIVSSPRLSAPRVGEPPAAAAEPVPPPKLTPDALYRSAEVALAVHDLAAADHALAKLVAEHPGAQLVDQALYERARIAYQLRAWTTAQNHLARLIAMPNTPLAEPGRYLRCRIAVETGDAGAAGCLTEYRQAFPRGSHDLDVLALLAQLAYRDGGCAGAMKLVDELAQSYPRTRLAAAWRARCPEAR